MIKITKGFKEFLGTAWMAVEVEILKNTSNLEETHEIVVYCKRF